MGKFLKGLFFGSLFGAGMLWLNTTAKGKQVREQILDTAAEVYVKLKNEVLSSPKYKKLKKNEYIKLVEEYVNKYAIENGLANNVKKMITKLVSAQWKNISE